MRLETASPMQSEANVNMHFYVEKHAEKFADAYNMVVNLQC